MSSRLGVLVRDGMRHRVASGYGQLARMILVSLARRRDIAVHVDAPRREWDEVPRREEIERIPVARADQCDVELWVCPPGASFPERQRPRVLYTQNALSDLPPHWADNLRHVDDVIVPGEFDRVVFSRYHQHVHVCHQVVDAGLFGPRPAWRQEGPETFCFIFVGTFGYRKGVDVLLRAFCRAFKRKDAELWVVSAGAGDLAFNRTLDLIQAFNPHARVRLFTEQRSPSWIARFYCRADAFVSLSRGEGWSMPLHEALLCGKPAVVSRSTAMAEAFGDEHVHFVRTQPRKIRSITDPFGASMVKAYGHGECELYEPDEDEAIACLQRVASNYEESAARAKAAAEHIKRSFTLESMGDKLVRALIGAFERCGGRLVAGEAGAAGIHRPAGGQPPAQDARSAFTRIYEESAWRGAVSVSGPGSNLAATALIRPALSALFAELGIRRLLDAPCGDSGWISEVTGELESYVGVDIVDALIEENRKRHRQANRSFQVADVIHDQLPAADAVLCRDCLVHLPLDAAKAALANMFRSGARYLIATTFPTVTENRPSGFGGWRPLNLCRPPFDLPPPMRLIRERADDPRDKYRDKSLGVWEMDALRPIAEDLEDSNSLAAHLFVHVPKTAGTSFRNAFSEAFPGSLALDYTPESPMTDPAVRVHVYEHRDFNALRAWISSAGVLMLGGHVPFSRYAQLFPPSRVITFLREPIARVVSEFEHARRHQGYQGALLEFASLERNRDLQSFMLRGVPLGEAAFVGITERYRESITILNRRLGWRLPVLELNVNPQRPGVLAGGYPLTEEEMAQLRAWNQEDLVLHAEAVRRFDEALSAA